MPNRLAKEISPYLQQHANNPVDWYPWGDEALARAKREDKPIMLSIGYSACHWCHVMEHESFANDDIAQLMNENFVNIKVDREERPDIDHIYQLTVQLMGRSGGWPLTVFLTPEQKPFFAGTYFPHVDRYGVPGFPKVLQTLAQGYRERRADFESSAEELTRGIKSVLAEERGEVETAGSVPADALAQAAWKLAQRWDSEHGGFGGAPKFPNTMNLEVLLREGARNHHKPYLHMVEQALVSMRRGGIYDQLRGGFHRYSTDAQWLVPHFEKMLYDNALLSKLYVEAWRLTKNQIFAQTVHETLAYVSAEMTSPEGVFYSAQDADSEGVEGKFFVWTHDEVRALLDAEETTLACEWLGISPEGNFEEGSTVLFEAVSLDTLAERHGLTLRELSERCERIKTTMLGEREKRIRPMRDDKIIVAWNALMISAFAHAGAAFDRRDYCDMAERALVFIKARLFSEGRLARIYKDGQTRGTGFLEDYAHLAVAALDVFECTFRPAHLDFAVSLLDSALGLFWDDATRRLGFSPKDGERLIVAPTDTYDNATPSGTSTLCEALLRAHSHTQHGRFFEVAEHLLTRLALRATKTPSGYGHLLCALDRYLRGATQMVIIGSPDDITADELVRRAQRSFVPNRALTRLTAIQDLAPHLSALLGSLADDSSAHAYVCMNRTCYPPVQSADALSALIGKTVGFD